MVKCHKKITQSEIELQDEQAKENINAFLAKLKLQDFPCLKEQIYYKINKNYDFLFFDSRELLPSNLLKNKSILEQVNKFSRVLLLSSVFSLFAEDTLNSLEDNLKYLKMESDESFYKVMPIIMQQAANKKEMQYTFGENACETLTKGDFGTCFHQSEQVFLRAFFHKTEGGLQNPFLSSLSRELEQKLKAEILQRSHIQFQSFEIEKEKKKFVAYSRLNNYENVNVNIASLKHICVYCRGSLYRAQEQIKNRLRNIIENLEIDIKEQEINFDDSFNAVAEGQEANRLLKSYKDQNGESIKQIFQSCDTKKVKFILSEVLNVNIYVSGSQECDEEAKNLIGRVHQ